jgi:CBS domain-containing protein
VRRNRAVLARDIMTMNVITVHPDATVTDLAKLLQKHRISGVPVVNETGAIMGMVSEADLMMKIARPHLPAHIQLLGGIIYLESPAEMDSAMKKALAMQVSDIMTTRVIAVEEDDLVEDVANLMIEKRVNRVPVLDEGRLSGIITRADIIKTLVQGDERDMDST